MSGGIDREIFVSLQKTSASNAVDGRLAIGALLRADCAVLDLPPEFELAPDSNVEVLIAPVDLREDDVIERIRPVRLIIRSLAASPQMRAALVPLVQKSRYRPPVPPALPRDVVLDALERTGEFWAAMEELGYVSRVVRERDPVPVLERVAAVELHRRLRLIDELRGRWPGEIADCVVVKDTICGLGPFTRKKQ